MFDEKERKFAWDKIIKDVSSWTSITGHFKCERYPETELLDTDVKLEIPLFAITWKDREKLMGELAEVIEKYLI